LCAYAASAPLVLFSSMSHCNWGLNCLVESAYIHQP
jgi:hypothetical protein